VTDKSGALRDDLKQNDFQVTEDGVPQQILHFEPPAAHALPPGPAITSTAQLQQQAPQAPVNVIVLDELNTRFEDMAFARYELQKYLNAQPGALGAPTELLAISPNRMLVLKDYTQDKAAILQALKNHLANYPWQLQRGVNPVMQLSESLGALQQVAQAAAGHPGHKNLLWVGHGFPGIQYSNPNLDSNAKGSIDSAVQRTVNLLRDSRVTLYTIDPSALSSTVAYTSGPETGPMGSLTDPMTDPFSGDVNFIDLAKATGGRSYFHRNDVDAEVGESARDGMNYYTITYRPSNASDAAKPYRKIRITLTEAGLRAGFRDGYYTRNDAALRPVVQQATNDDNAAAASTLVYTGLSVTAVAKPDAPGTYYVGVPESQLTWTGDGAEQTGKVSLIAAAVDRKGRVVKQITNDLTVRRQSADAVSDTKLARLEISLPAPPDAVRVRFVLRNAADGHIGSADIRLPGAGPDAKPER
jgi:VWFA-related protein